MRLVRQNSDRCDTIKHALPALSDPSTIRLQSDRLEGWKAGVSTPQVPQEAPPGLQRAVVYSVV